MAFVINEYKILRILKQYFSYLKNSSSDFSKTFDYIFEVMDVDQANRNAFRDIIKNDKIQLRTSYNNLSAEFPNIVVIMDQEIQRDKPVGDYVGGENLYTGDEIAESEAYGFTEDGVYSINVIGKQILLVRLLGTLVRVILEHYSTNNSDNIADLEINVDRFSPDADYFPTDSYHVHLIARFRYLETWDQIYGLINSIYLQSCGAEAYDQQRLREAIYLSLSLDIDSSFGQDYLYNPEGPIKYFGITFGVRASLNAVVSRIGQSNFEGITLTTSSLFGSQYRYDHNLAILAEAIASDSRSMALDEVAATILSSTSDISVSEYYDKNSSLSLNAYAEFINGIVLAIDPPLDVSADIHSDGGYDVYPTLRLDLTAAISNSTTVDGLNDITLQSSALIELFTRGLVVFGVGASGLADFDTIASVDLVTARILSAISTMSFATEIIPTSAAILVNTGSIRDHVLLLLTPGSIPLINTGSIRDHVLRKL